ncbi:MAG: hypothetical protein CUN55_17165 [Phototrophicales bacterium]|nr:MAG: hypothetical protein CUN55_17165 [Phototrophicales bacterium]
MMMSDDAQKKASMIMVKIGKGEVGVGAEIGGAEQDQMSGVLEDAAMELIDAIKGEDPKEVAYALKNFIMCCGYDED